MLIDSFFILFVENFIKKVIFFNHFENMNSTFANTTS